MAQQTKKCFKALILSTCIAICLASLHRHMDGQDLKVTQKEVTAEIPMKIYAQQDSKHKTVTAIFDAEPSNLTAYLDLTQQGSQ